MSIEEERAILMQVYSGGAWVDRVKKMRDAQVHAVYLRLVLSGKIV